MTKTEQQIERDLYAMIKASSLGTSIRGSVYRSEMRAADATTEDVIVKFLAGVDEQIQQGVVVINIYVPDIRYDGRLVPDKSRIGELQQLVIDFIEQCDSVEYWIVPDSTPYTASVEGVDQHVIISRIKFSRIIN